jgi:fermentation-respiration switch protein FrsA (DUF1100 family)
MLETIAKTVGQLVLVGGGLYLVLLLYVYWNQGSMIHLPNTPGRHLGANPQEIDLEYETVTLSTGDGIRLKGWFLPVEQPRAWVLFLHGNAGNISHRLDTLEFLHELELAVFIFDYRGYGESGGRPSEAGLYRDAEAAWSYLTETRGIPGNEILLFGRSLGGAVAAYLAERHEAMGLVLESTFTSVPAVAAQHYPWLPVRQLTRYRYDTASRLSDIEMPVLIIHSPEDEIIPFSHSQELYELAREPKCFLEIQGSHNTGMFENWETYRRGWNEFILYCSRPLREDASP